MFPCTLCGLCCQNITNVDELKSFDIGNGTCMFFNSIDKSCKIYHTRPDICSVTKMFDLKYKKYFSKNEFYKLNADVCNELQELHNLEQIFRIKLGE